MMWSRDEIVHATGGQCSAGAFEVTSVAIDSRKVTPGALFVALKGERFDGHDFVAKAFSAGAKAALVERIPSEAAKLGIFILVPDVYEAMLALARESRRRMQGKVIAVTGSVGKTGTKEAIRIAAASAGKVYATQGNLNNHIGLPLSLCNMEADTACGVFELGMNHAGEIALLTRLARPDVAVITNVEAVHLEFFRDVEAIAEAKAEIMEGLTEGGTLVLNRDNAMYAKLADIAKAHGITKIVTFGAHEEANCRLIAYSLEGVGSRIEARIGSTPLTYRLGTIGEHWAYGSLAALAAVTAVGMDLAEAAAALAHFQEPEGRGKLERLAWGDGSITLIDDSYNASPASMKTALGKLSEVDKALGENHRKIAVLGDMLELGEASADLHRGLLHHLQANRIDKVFASGAMMKHLYELLPSTMKGAYAEDAKQLASQVIPLVQPGDILLIKGSHGSRMDIVRDMLQTQAKSSLKEIVNAL